jgi:hypothetical protein
MKAPKRGSETAWWQIFAIEMALMLFVYMLVFLVGELAENIYGPNETLGGFVRPLTAATA